MSESEAKIAEQSNTPTFGLSYWPILTDYLVRWILLELLRFGLIAKWIWWTSQILVLPVILLVWLIERDRRIGKKYNLQKSQSPEDTVWSILFYLFVISSISYAAFKLSEGWPLYLRIIFSIAVFIIYGFYVGLLSVFSLKPKSKQDLRRERETLEGTSPDEEPDPIDKNDVRIIKMEAEVVSISQRVESYTFESALLGALAFSGFLTLIASEKHVLENLSRVLPDTSSVVDGIRLAGLAWFMGLIQNNLNESSLIAIVTLETLICSMFFLSVIVSRLRFYGFLKRVDYEIRLARAYNDKEEELYGLKLEMADPANFPEDRLQSLNAKVSDTMDRAAPLLNDVSSIAGYMAVFRNLGILTFILILITSAFLISRKLALLFIIISTLAYLYTTLDKWRKNKRIVAYINAQKQKAVRRSLGSKTPNEAPVTNTTKSPAS